MPEECKPPELSSMTWGHPVSGDSVLLSGFAAVALRLLCSRVHIWAGGIAAPMLDTRSRIYAEAL